MTPKHSSAAFALNMAIHANLYSLVYQLDAARQLALDARDAMEAHQRNLAVGTVMPLETVLPDCLTLLRSVLVLQTWLNQIPAAQENAA